MCISDLEGCQLQSNEKVKQHTHFCSDEFFDALEKAMVNNNDMQIVFLGDYFDMGNLVEQSIAFIVDLKKKYSDRVHIILGNRDVNKLRFLYETKTEAFDPSLKQTTGWGGKVLVARGR